MDKNLKDILDTVTFIREKVESKEALDQIVGLRKLDKAYETRLAQIEFFLDGQSTGWRATSEDYLNAQSETSPDL
jgi:hypothetical protein